jgi:hypothetical protein
MLCPFIIIIKKISNPDSPLKPVYIPKITAAVGVSVSFALVTFLFINNEFVNSLFSSFMNEKSSDSLNFSEYFFPLQMIIILMIVTLVIIRSMVKIDSEEKEND